MRQPYYGLATGCRVANVGSNASIDSGQVAFQYWFNGPMDLPDAADPLSQLTMDCLDATTGKAVILTILLGARSSSMIISS